MFKYEVMSNAPAISVSQLNKKFSRRSDQHKSHSLFDLLKEALFHKRNPELREDEFYAVSNVSFEVQQGECVGIIGRNGCGKTTLLKMVAGLVSPEAGSIRVNGNLQALIALGAGFDKQLNGIENIRTAATLSGLSGKETRNLVEEVIDFSELEDAIESPVFTYSSGMYARLGFSVAAFLDPKILVIDEILGVGDFSFQNKCYRKIQEIRSSGTTILLVSHSESKIIQLCDRAIWLDKGVIVSDGPADEVVKKYIETLQIEEAIRDSKRTKKYKDKPTESSRKYHVDESPYGPLFNAPELVDDITVELETKGEGGYARTHDPLKIRYRFILKTEVQNLNVSVNILSKEGTLLTTISTLNGNLLANRTNGQVTGVIAIEDLCLNPGSYVITFPIHDGQSYLCRTMPQEFTVLPPDSMTWGLIDLKHTYHVYS